MGGLEYYKQVFIDTPGVVAGEHPQRMNRKLLNASWQSLREADHGIYD